MPKVKVNKYVTLDKVAYFANEKIESKYLNQKNYISTENMLPDKGGITIALSNPQGNTKSKFSVDDILLSNIRPYFRKIWFADIVGGCSNDILVLKAKDNICPKFLYYVLSDNNFFNYATVTSKGTKMPRGSKHAIMKYLVPNLEQLTQQRIANILSNYDDLIENNNRRIELLEKSAQELYKEWFVRFRFPNYENTKFVNGLPEGWEVKKVSDTVKRLPFGKLYKENMLESNGDVIVIDQSRKEFLGFHNEKPSHYANKNSPKILFGDHSCKMNFMVKDFSLAENVIPFVSYEEIHIAFLFYMVNSLINTTEYKRHWTEFMNKKTLLPNYDLRDKFGNNVLDKLVFIDELNNQNQNLKKQRDLLLPRLMSGKLKV